MPTVSLHVVTTLPCVNWMITLAPLAGTSVFTILGWGINTLPDCDDANVNDKISGFGLVLLNDGFPSGCEHY